MSTPCPSPHRESHVKGQRQEVKTAHLKCGGYETLLSRSPRWNIMMATAEGAMVAGRR
jgi:hypothetical protein